MALSSAVLIGRDDLLALATRRLASAAAGRGELLLLAGEAGIGKTRLLSEITRLATEAGFAVIGAAAAPGDTEVAAGLLTDLGAELRERIVRRLRADDEPDRQRRLLVADLTDLIERAAGAGPTLITCEDLHWTDELTLDVLGRLARRARELPVLLVGTYRSDELYPRVPLRAWRTRLLTQRHAEELRLPRLGRAETAELAAAIAGTALPTALTGRVFDRSDGVPLHVEEFLAAADSLPDTLADAVLARAAQLGTEARELAAAASVLGRSFDLDLLLAITGRRPAEIDAGMRELGDRFFVQPRGDGAGYDFRHALIRDALYADLTPLHRRRLHARAAEAARQAGLPAAFLSDQYERARSPAEAHRYALTAATEAAALSAHREAADLFGRAVRTLGPDATGDERAALCTALAGELAAIDDNAAADARYAEAYRLHLEAGDRLAAAALLPDRVAVRHLLGDRLDQRTAALRTGLDLVGDAAGERARSVRARLHAALAAAYMLDRRLHEALADGELARSMLAGDRDPAMRCDLDTTVGSVLLFAGRLDEGRELLEDAVARAAARHLESQAARGYRMLSSSASVLVEYDLAERTLREGIEYADRVERFNDRHYMAAHLAHVLWATGDWTGAEAQVRLALADGRDGITTRITALHTLGYLRLGRGATPEARDALTEAAELGAGMRELQRVSPAWWGLAELALFTGYPAAAVQRCEQGYAASAQVRDAAYLFPYVVTGTRAHLASSGPTAARDWLVRTGEVLSERRIPGTLGALDHARGLIHLHEGQTGKARDELRRAAAFWTGRRRFWEGVAVRLDRARCAYRSRRPGEAADLVAAARQAWPAELPPVWTAGTPVAAPAERSGLSAREMEVARLVAAGNTDREIAGTLSISPRTAAAHVEHIRVKLGISRRTQIAGWLAKVEPSS
ncbi:ATP-binding protein [Actinoplanes aureus]|uniref:AAA family ATPase n=1 Tax=Actinoplanes aureus TaxID=2792083 RepID=A0A931FX13_9ACTN|nr:LuxR family transcriptional regulator [Actinoplanes aureus]MBG0560341.1 AAA family ATPase [Actinoplanes aureus]